MKESELYEEIFSRYGAVTRARGCFLYTKKGVRLTDMFQAGGRAILGWGGGEAFTRFKNIMNRGLTGNFITEYSDKIDRACSDLFASYKKVFFYNDLKKALAEAEKICPESFGEWKPWSGVNFDASVFAPPLPWCENIFILAVPETFSSQSTLSELSDSPDSVSPKNNIVLPSALVASMTRIMYDLIQALQNREEKNWFIYDSILTKFFERKGPYLYPKIAEKEYDDFVKKCLDAGVVISPEYCTPSIIPFGADKGVFTKLKLLTVEAEK